MPKNLQTPAEHVAQLQAIAAAQASPPRFTVGQLVRPADFAMACTHRPLGHIGISVVVEIIPDLRERTGDIEDGSGEGLRLGSLEPDGSYVEGFRETWQYEVVPPDQIAALLGQTSH